MRSNKLRRVLLLCLALVLGPFIVLQVQSRVQNIKQVEPFFLEVTSKSLIASSTAPIVRELTGVREDGSTFVRRFFVGSDGTEQEVTRVTLVKERKTVAINPAVNSTTTSSLTDRDIESIRRMDPYCGVGSPAERSQILGYAVVKNARARTENDADNEEHWETWVAPEFGCFPLKTVLSQNGTVKQITEVKWIRKEAPPKEYFDMPADYSEMKPSQVMEALTRKFGGQPFDKERFAKMDQVYLSRQEGAPN